uniref:Uncharacterized protein n=1 Tax=Lepeophtheirus salmonis TaxID=72036 RepID=A0A0K2UWM0_LEPSM
MFELTHKIKLFFFLKALC